jgi:outer membrane receptor protein involved in Fe transport
MCVNLTSFGLSQTTGKLAGTIVDKQSKNPLPGANIILEKISYGAATDERGQFHIINIPPGMYSVSIMMIGYKTVKVNDVRISTNRSVSLDIEMETTVIEGEVVTVEVARLAQKKDQTSTIKNISGDEINALPVESIGAVINMQAGVVNGHFRGGRNTEVTYLIDGVQVDETFGGNNAAVEIQPEAVQDLEVITGTFNAEYGRAMSGVVNVVTKNGGPKFEGFASSALSSYITDNTNIFIGLSQELSRSQDLKFSLGGPLLGEKITFFTNVRTQDNRGHLNGYRIFTVTDTSDFYSDDPSLWESSKSGDSTYVPMNTGNNQSLLFKLRFNLIKGIRFSLLNSTSNDTWFWYDHAFKYNPDGRAGAYKETVYSAYQLNHMITPKLFYELKLSFMKNNTGNYLYEDSLDTRYVHDKYLENYGSGFFTGGQQKEHTKHRDIDKTAKFDLTWQANHNHNFKLGLMGISHDVKHKWQTIRNKYDGETNQNDLYEPEVFGDSTVYADIYKVKPQEAAAYFQDKMEFEEMVINFGVRYDYFDPASVYPSDRRNPANQLLFYGSSGDGMWNEGEEWTDSNDNGIWDWLDANGNGIVDSDEAEVWIESMGDTLMSTYPQAPVIEQVSPRIGFAYQLGNQAVLHFSYGHFFQMPPLYAMYQNHSFLVGPNDYGTTMGNVLLKPEKTITYELGLWQELTRGVSLDVALFYRDIYNLLSTKIISTYNQIEYGLYSNKDYGNARGLEIKLDLGYGSFKGTVNYTLQYTRGNADNPTQTFNRAGDSMDPVNRLIPMSWDQRHTLNGTVMFSMKNYGGTVTAYYNSGTPYTFSPQSESILSRINLYPNNAYKPATATVDATLYYNFKLMGRLHCKIDLTIYNLLDRLNENWVDSETGRAYTAVIRETDLAGHRSDYNNYEDRIQNPSMYSAPRAVKLALGINF